MSRRFTVLAVGLVLSIAMSFCCSAKSVSKESHLQQTPLGDYVANSLIQRYQPTIDAMTHHGWDHSNSIVLHGIEKIYLKTKNKKYLAYIKRYVDDFVQADGSIRGLETTLDGLHPGVLCLFLYEQTGQEKYKLAAKTMRDFLMGTAASPSQFAKTPDGGFWHKNNEKYKHVMSVDGLYMYTPFLIRYGVKFNDAEAVDLATQQILLVSERSFNIKTNLPFHAWNYDKSKPWAHPVTGTATQHWSRAAGWFAMALADALEFLPKEQSSYKKIVLLCESLAAGAAAYQNPANGFWYQVVDQASQTDNYPETSGTGMLVYGLQKAVNLNLIDPKYHAVAEKAWLAIKTQVSVYSDGGVAIASIAPPMGAQNDYAGYVAIRPISLPSGAETDPPHGYMALLMAAAVMEI